MNSDINPFVDIARLVAAGVVGGLVATIAAHFLAKSRAKASGIMAEKMKLIPLIDRMFIQINNSGGLLGEIRREIHPLLQEPAMRFRLHLNGEKLRAFNDAWERLANTTWKEVENRQPNTSEAEFKKMEQTLISRLESLKKAASDV